MEHDESELFSSIFDMGEDNSMLFQLDPFSSDGTNSNSNSNNTPRIWVNKLNIFNQYYSILILIGIYD